MVFCFGTRRSRKVARQAFRSRFHARLPLRSTGNLLIRRPVLPVPPFPVVLHFGRLRTIRTWAYRRHRTPGTAAETRYVDWEQAGNSTKNKRERTDHMAFLYRHSRRDPCRSRYRSQPNVRRQRAARFLSVCVHNA
jgi:hypothetical protein